MKRMGLLSLALATAVTVACNGNARTDNTAANDRDATVGTSGVAERNNGSAADRGFIQEMMAGGDAEVQLGKMAEQRASSPEVKRFAAMMVADHTKAGEELKKIAAEYSIQPDPSKVDDHKSTIDKLSKLSGADFDRAYMSAMVDDHQDTIDSLKKHVDIDHRGDQPKGTSGTTIDANAKPEKADNHVEYSANNWAAMTLPKVEHHLDQAKQIQDKLNRK